MTEKAVVFFVFLTYINRLKMANGLLFSGSVWGPNRGWVQSICLLACLVCLVFGQLDFVVGFLAWSWLSAVLGIEINEFVEFCVWEVVGLGLGMLSIYCGYSTSLLQCTLIRGVWDVGIGNLPRARRGAILWAMDWPPVQGVIHLLPNDCWN